MFVHPVDWQGIQNMAPRSNHQPSFLVDRLIQFTLKFFLRPTDRSLIPIHSISVFNIKFHVFIPFLYFLFCWVWRRAAVKLFYFILTSLFPALVEGEVWIAGFCSSLSLLVLVSLFSWRRQCCLGSELWKILEVFTSTKKLVLRNKQTTFLQSSA